MSPTHINSRRDFIKDAAAVATAGITLAAVAPELFSAESSAQERLRIAQVGTGSRGTSMWGPALERQFPERVDTVGLCDINPKRVKYAQSLFEKQPPTFTDFDRMIRETKPDAVIVTTVDSAHAKYVVRAMELGCDVICEKPLATTAEDCQKIYDAEKKFGKKVTVTFNARHFPEKKKIRELLLDGAIGDLYSIDYAEMLDLTHGGHYFRRWHGIKEKSGTLLVHKASHHFDQVNWWVDSEPELVSAFGELRKYGANGPFRSTHCRSCPHEGECDFYWDITKSEESMRLYVDCEDEDGYLRDACLYRKEINSYDAMSVQCRYQNGVILSYSLNATSPIEGQIITLNGSRGRIELRVFQKQPWEPESKAQVRLINNNPLHSTIVPTQRGEGGHGGADPALKKSIFLTDTPDQLGLSAGSRAGILSSMIGIAGYHSIESQQIVRINDLVEL